MQTPAKITGFKEAMGWRYSHTSPNTRRQRASPGSTSTSGRQWTIFEQEALLGLLAAQHHNGDPLEFATMLNKALNDSDYHSDISTNDIQQEVGRLLHEHPNFAGFLARHGSSKMTRQLKRVFHRALKYSGDNGGGRRGRVRSSPARAISGADNDWGNGDAIPSSGADGTIGWGNGLNNISNAEPAPPNVELGGDLDWGIADSAPNVGMADEGWGAGDEQLARDQVPETNASQAGWGAGTGELLPSDSTTLPQVSSGGGSDGQGSGEDQM
ncbi:MAG: hypothetical protein M1839_000501 [Geoglossum umbratile]|nr:MAG: hypothetical protein M1839_000501 [Geoglossum umbratile]